jgi:Cu/Ag efflux protein CusF
LLAANTNAQDKSKGTPMIFHGKVEAVTDKGLTVNGEKLEGWMDAMTMSYPVDKPEVLKKVKVGDTIMVTVYKGPGIPASISVSDLKSSLNSSAQL